MSLNCCIPVCGEYKNKDEVQKIEEEYEKANQNLRFEGRPTWSRRKRQTDDEGVKFDPDKIEFFTYSNGDDDRRNIQCGSVVISDRFALSAAHCYTKFGVYVCARPPVNQVDR